MRVAGLVLFALLLFVSALVPTTLAQVPDPVAAGQTPIPGAGHHYIGAGSETVNPADGSLSFNLPIQTPPGRQLSFPFAIRYSSSGVWYAGGDGVGSGLAWKYWPTTPHGWGYNLPSYTAASYIKFTQPASQPPNGNYLYCMGSRNYTFRGFDGIDRAMQLGGMWPDPSFPATSCPASPGAGSSSLHGFGAYTPNPYSNWPNQPPLTVTDPSGTVYQFPVGPATTYNGYGPWAESAQTITDRNGNQISLNASQKGYTDTLGRTVVSWTGGNPDQLTVSGLSSNILIYWTNVTRTFPETGHEVYGNTCALNSSAPQTTSEVSQIALPNGQKFTFAYDSTYGRVNKITFPTGGYVRYVWGMNPSSAVTYYQWNGGISSCYLVFDTDAVTDRYVSYDGSTEVLHQHFAYPATTWAANNPPTSYPYQWTSKQTIVTTTDLLTNQVTVTTYTYTSVPPDSGGPNDESWLVPQIPVEQSVVYQDGSGNTLKTVNKTWKNAFAMVGEQTILDNGQGITSLRCYNGGEQVTDVYEYGFQSEGSKPADPSCASSSGLNTSAIGPLKRHTATVYHNFAGPGPINEPDSVTVYDGSSNQVKQTTFTYDANGVVSSGTATGLVAPPGARGNVSTITRWLNTGGSSPVSSYAYFDTGQVYQMTDACGNTACSDMTGSNHTTTYSYSDNYASGTGTPSGQTFAYLTQVTHPNTGVAHVEKFTWGFSDGLLRTSTDQNNLVTTYCYWTGGCSGSTLDPLLRLTQITNPDGGGASYSYSDTPPSPTVTTTKKINSSQSLTTVAVMDGMGHTKQTQLTSDPQGTVYTDTTFDGFGRVWKQSNPYRSTNDPTYGVTTNVYDALGRTIQVIPPDGLTYSNYVSTQYSGNCTVVTDQTLRARKSCTDSLGRLMEVDEPSATLSISYPTPGTGTVSISGTENMSVSINGCPNTYPYNCWYTAPDQGTVYISVNGHQDSASYNGNTPTSSLVASALASVINADSSSFVTASVSGSTITLTAKAGGTSTNYSLSAWSNTNYPQYTSPSFTASASGSTLTGGTNGTPAPLNFPSPYVTLYTYDFNNNLLSVTQKGGSTDSTQWRPRSFMYDSLSRLLCSSNPENSSAACPTTATSNYTAGTTGYTYDANGNVSTKEDARAIITTYGYDVLNRGITTSYSNGDPTITTTYDQSNCLSLAQCQNVGHRTSMTDASGSELWAYDVPDRIHREQRTTNSIQKTTTYTLDYAGNVISAVYPTGRTVNYTLDSANRPSVATDSSNGITYAQGNCANGVGSNGVCYAPQGALSFTEIGVSSSLPAGVNLTNSYNNRLQPHELKASSTGGNAFDITYNFLDSSGHNAGHVYGITNNLDSTRSQTFTYDQLNRITSALTTSTHATSPAHCWGEVYTIDPWSNLTSIAATTNSAYTGCTQESGFPKSADGSNHLSGFTYDAAGNTQNDGVNSYTWDAESQLKTAAGVTYAYDGDGRRAAKAGSKLYWYGSGGEILAETDANGNTTNEYIYFGGKRVALLPAGSTAQFYAEDLLGSSRVVTSNTGVVCYDADFYPFGGERTVTNSCTQNNYKFEGKERDTETGNDDFGARYYSNRFGRWLSADWSSVPAPVPYANLTNPQTLNLYAMVADDPETFADLDGHCYGNCYSGANYQGYDQGITNCGSHGEWCDYTPDFSITTTEKLSQASANQTAQQVQNPPMSLSSQGLDFIAHHEARPNGQPALTVYPDIYGNPTIGYGHLVRPGENFSNGITPQQAKNILARDAKDAVSFVNKHNKSQLSQSQFDALVSVAFNSPRAALKLQNLVNNGGKPSKIEFINTLPKGPKSPRGLINRRTHEANLFLNGNYGGAQ